METPLIEARMVKAKDMGIHAHAGLARSDDARRLEIWVLRMMIPTACREGEY